jgi:hypothetical protein
MPITISIPSPDDLLPDLQVAQRYQVTLRTVARWDEDPELDFPKAFRVKGRKYRRVKELESWERKRAARDAGSARRKHPDETQQPLDAA